MPGAGSGVLARTVANEASRKDCSVSENTTNAEPTEGWPASSSVDTNHTDGAACSSRPERVSPLAAKRSSSSSWACTWDTASSRDEIGRASCRERVCQYGKISVVAGAIKNKKK